jgi:hypothetical protein
VRQLPWHRSVVTAYYCSEATQPHDSRVRSHHSQYIVPFFQSLSPRLLTQEAASVDSSVNPFCNHPSHDNMKAVVKLIVSIGLAAVSTGAVNNYTVACTILSLFSDLGTAGRQIDNHDGLTRSICEFSETLD